MKSPRNKTITVDQEIIQTELKNALILTKDMGIDEIKNKIIHGDLFDCHSFLPSSFVDLLITDPPYNLTKEFGGTVFNKTTEKDYRFYIESWILLLKRFLKPTSSIYICCDWQSSNAIYSVLSEHFIIRNRITWEREKGRGSKTNWKNCSEDIWFCTKTSQYCFNVEDVKLKKKVIASYRDESGNSKDWQSTVDGNYRLTYPSNLWTDISIPFWSMPENTDHPTQKPEKLIAKLILASSNKGDFVFDPFLGSGTTAVVAKKLNRIYSGVEQEKEYCGFTVKRLEQSTSSISGYEEGVFWERNSKPERKNHINIF